jgi:hypothetical protein
MALNGQTPARKAGIADHQWTITEIAALLDHAAWNEPGWLEYP